MAIKRKGAKITGVGRNQVKPKFETLFDNDTLDPLKNLNYTGDIETDAENEVSEILAAIKQEKQERRDQYRLLVDSEFWLCICFQSREQKDQFLDMAGWQRLGDKYLDGLKVAELMEMPLEPIMLPKKTVREAPVLLRKTPTIPKKGGDG